MLRGRRYRNYLAWRLIEEDACQQIQLRDEQRRHFLRNVIDPMDITDQEFVKRYRLSKEAFIYLCNALSSQNLIKDTQRVSLRQKILCALAFYATGSYQHIVGMSNYVGQSTVSMYVEEVTNALNTIASDFIKFPNSPEERERIKQKFYQKYGYPGVLGCVDGCHFHIFKPKLEIEHLFFNRKHFHSLNALVICDSDAKIIYINPKYGGQAHDSFVWTNSALCTHVESLFRNGEQGWLVGDSGYPQRPWLMTPILNPTGGSPKAKFNSVHCRTRVIIEITFGMLKNRWRCLSKDRTLHYAPCKCAKIITACVVLHNIAIEFRIPISEEVDTTDHFDEAINDVLREAPSDDLSTGRALRSVLVDKINTLHRITNL